MAQIKSKLKIIYFYATIFELILVIQNIYLCSRSEVLGCMVVRESFEGVKRDDGDGDLKINGFHNIRFISVV